MSSTTDFIIRVALVEDDQGTRTRLRSLLLGNPHLQLVFEAGDAQTMLAWLRDPQTIAPEVLLVDLGLPDGSGLDVIAVARLLMPRTDSLVITMFGDEANMIKAFEAGAKGYLLKDGSQNDLAEHVMNLHAGGAPMSPIIARRLIARLAQSNFAASTAPAKQAATQELAPCAAPVARAAQCTDKVTTRELEVLRLIARGYNYSEIANLLGLTIHTIHSHVRSIYGKLAVNSKTEAVFEARQLGLLD